MIYFRVWYLKHFCGEIALNAKDVIDNKSSLDWFRKWLVVIKQQAITWTNADPSSNYLEISKINDWQNMHVV